MLTIAKIITIANPKITILNSKLIQFAKIANPKITILNSKLNSKIIQFANPKLLTLKLLS